MSVSCSKEDGWWSECPACATWCGSTGLGPDQQWCATCDGNRYIWLEQKPTKKRTLKHPLKHPQSRQ